MDFKGIDVDLNVKVVNTNKTKFDVGFNMGWVDMEVKKLNSSGTIDDKIGQLNGLVENPYVQSLSAGRIPYEYYVYKQVYDTNGKPLEGVFADIKGDGKITADDKYSYRANH